MEFHGYERDFVWPDHGLVVEYDGWDGHKTRGSAGGRPHPRRLPRGGRRSRCCGSPGCGCTSTARLGARDDRPGAGPADLLDAEPVQQRVVAAPALAHPHLQVEVHPAARAASRAACGRRCRSPSPSGRRSRSGSPSGTRSRPRSAPRPAPARRRARRSRPPPPPPRAAAPRACAAAPARAPAPPAARARAGRSSPRPGRGTGPPGPARPGARPARPTPVPFFALIGKISPGTPSSSAATRPAATRAGSSRSTLFTAVTAGRPESATARAMKRSPGPTCGVGGQHEQHGVGVGQRVLHAPLHPLGHRVARALHARQVHQHQLPVLARGDAPDLPAGGLGLVGDDRHLLAHHPVHQRRLAGVRAAGQGDEARPHRSPSITRSWSASISPSSVSWS